MIKEEPTLDFLKPLRILFVCLMLAWVSIVSAETLISVGTGQSYTDLGDAITAALNVTTDSDVVIRIYPNNTPYVAPQNGFVINMGSTLISSLTLEGYSTADLVCINGPLKVFNIIGSPTSYPDITIRNLQLVSGWECIDYSERFGNREIVGCVINAIKGIHLGGALDSKNVSIRNNLFQTNGGWGLVQPARLDTIMVETNEFTGTYDGSYLTLSGAIYTSVVNNTFDGQHSENNGMLSLTVSDSSDGLAHIARFFISYNTFVDSKIYVSDVSGEIKNNNFRFHNCTPGSLDCFIKVIVSEIDLENDPVIISHNLFKGACTFAAVHVEHNNSGSKYQSVTANLNHNTFWANGYALLIQIAPDIDDGEVIIPQFSGNLFYQCNPSIINAKTTDWIDCQLPDPIIACYSVAYPSIQNSPNLTYDFTTSVVADPLINYQTQSGTYTLTWTDSEKSPCINTGYPGENNELTDPDGTPPDIGCVYYPHYHREYFDRHNPSGIYWLSFPTVDDRTSSNVYDWNMLGHVFSYHMVGPPDSLAQLNRVQWSYSGYSSDMYYYYPDWVNPDHPITQHKGYKVRFNPQLLQDTIIVNGFKIEPDIPASWVRERNIGGQPVPFENWIGYYVPFTQKAGDALSRMIPGSNSLTYLDYVHCIKTQNWSTSRISEDPTSRWIVDPDKYTLSEGEMVGLLLLKDAPSEMYWKTDGFPTTPIVRTPTSAFTYEEKLDYTPVFIEFDPADIPDEVGLYVDGMCKGATVVDSSLIDVCFYNEAAKEGSELEIMFYYEGKGKKAAKGWTSYNTNSMVFENSGIDVNNIGSYAYISFRSGEGDSPVPLITTLKPNYPNPFNPSTNISFILAKDMDARLEVFNLRGQRVKTLCKTQISKGKHTYVWNGKDDQGRQVASGIYFSRLTTLEGSFVQKMMLMK